MQDLLLLLERKVGRNSMELEDKPDVADAHKMIADTPVQLNLPQKDFSNATVSCLHQDPHLFPHAVRKLPTFLTRQDIPLFHKFSGGK